VTAALKAILSAVNRGIALGMIKPNPNFDDRKVANLR